MRRRLADGDDAGGVGRALAVDADVELVGNVVAERLAQQLEDDALLRRRERRDHLRHGVAVDAVDGEDDVPRHHAAVAVGGAARHDDRHRRLAGELVQIDPERARVLVPVERHLEPLRLDVLAGGVVGGVQRPGRRV